jgi:hypothetical protein
MASKSEVESWELWLSWALLCALFILFGKLFWEPTYYAMKRIESMKPCATSGENK